MPEDHLTLSRRKIVLSLVKDKVERIKMPTRGGGELGFSKI